MRLFLVDPSNCFRADLIKIDVNSIPNGNCNRTDDERGLFDNRTSLVKPERSSSVQFRRHDSRIDVTKALQQSATAAATPPVCLGAMMMNSRRRRVCNVYVCNEKLRDFLFWLLHTVCIFSDCCMTAASEIFVCEMDGSTKSYGFNDHSTTLGGFSSKSPKMKHYT